MNLSAAMLKGLGTTFYVSLISLLICIVPGIILYLGSINRHKLVRLISSTYIEFFDAIPIIAQLLFIFYALPIASKSLTFSQHQSAFIILSLNGAANIASFAVMYAKDVKNIDGRNVSFLILLISIIRTFAELIKYSALLSLIALTDLLRVANTTMSARNDFNILVTAIMIYLLINLVLKILIKLIQRAFKIEISN